MRAQCKMLDVVESLRLRYRIAGEWRDDWDSVRPEMMPDAIEAVIALEGAPELRQLFLVGTGL